MTNKINSLALATDKVQQVLQARNVNYASKRRVKYALICAAYAHAMFPRIDAIFWHKMREYFKLPNDAAMG